MGSKKTSVGAPMNRVDGIAKVTGAAKYAAEFNAPRMAYAYAVTSEIAAGMISQIDIKKAEKAAGVLAVITHENAPRMGVPRFEMGSDDPSQNPFAKPIPVLQSPQIYHFGQYIAVVVAETYEQARSAARLIKAKYQAETPAVSLEKELPNAYQPKALLVPDKPDTARGDFAAGMRQAEATVDALYQTPNEHHTAMELHATIAAWEGDKLLLHDATQNVHGVQKMVALTLQIAPENIRVVSPFLGGGFGSKYTAWRHTILAAIAAQKVARPVKFVVPRQQTFYNTGFRSHSRQRVRLGAKRDGTLTAIGHEIHTQTAVFEEFVEQIGVATLILYATPNVLVTHRGVKLNLPKPTIMRAPGESIGTFALESAMDELAFQLKIDPIALRIKNEPPLDPQNNIPWTSRSLVECYRQGAAKIGWERRRPEPRSIKNGKLLVGLGCASATYPTSRLPAAASVRVFLENNYLRAEVKIAATDLGTGTYTALTQIAADSLGIAPENVRVEIGDTMLPVTPGSGGSWGAATFGTAVLEACRAVAEKFLRLAQMDASSPLKNASLEEVELTDERLQLKNDGTRGENLTRIFKRNAALKNGLEAKVDSKPDAEAAKKTSSHAFGAQFAEVAVDEDLGTVRVTRFVGAFGAGRILNQKTARSQMFGGIVWGIGAALTEETTLDVRNGFFATRSLADYHVPANLDVPPIEIIFVAENDLQVNPLGVKGIGEIGLVGASAAIANAVFNATGKRVRDLPLTPDKLL